MSDRGEAGRHEVEVIGCVNCLRGRCLMSWSSALLRRLVHAARQGGNAAVQVHFAVNHLGILIVHQPCSSILDGTRDICTVYRIAQIIIDVEAYIALVPIYQHLRLCT